MYRALTWWLLERGVDTADAGLVGGLAAEPHIEVGTDPQAPWVRVNGTDVSAAIRTREVTSAVSAVAAVPRVRAHLIAQQRIIISSAHGIVAEGRDIGTVVAPGAQVKVFLTADGASGPTAGPPRPAGQPPRPASIRSAATGSTPRRARRPTTRSRSIPPGSTLTKVIDVIVRLARERAGSAPRQRPDSEEQP